MKRRGNRSCCLDLVGWSREGRSWRGYRVLIRKEGRKKYWKGDYGVKEEEDIQSY